MDSETKRERLGQALTQADEMFKNGYTCAATTMQVLQDLHGIEGDGFWMAATGLGGGLGRCQDVCGALTGGAMAIGLIVGKQQNLDRESRKALRDEAYARVRQLYARFREEFGEVDCRTMTGFDLSTPEGNSAFQASGARDRVCAKAVRFVVAAAEELI